jgi:hypothetical protein
MVAGDKSPMSVALFQRSRAASVVPGLALLCLLASPSFAACDETPRGEQGIDFLDDGGYYNVPPAPEAGPDAHGPCANETDTSGICAQASVQGTPYTNLVECTGSAPPAEIFCIASGKPEDGGIVAYCCETGII